jgi:hypothetical protein
VPIPIGIIGIMFLFWGSVLMLRENADGDGDCERRDGFHMGACTKGRTAEVAIKYKEKGVAAVWLARIKDESEIPDTLSGE